MLKSVYDSDEDGVIAVAQTEADMTKSVYDTDEDGVIAVAQTEADMTKAVYDTDDDGKVDAVEEHATLHEDGGTDEIDVTGLIGRINLVDRGDPSDWDWTTGDFTIDGDYYDLDCSAIVPAGATAICFFLNFQHSTAGKSLYFSKKGNQYEINCQAFTCLSPTTRHLVNFTVFCDANRVIQYRGPAQVFSLITLVVTGWIL